MNRVNRVFSVKKNCILAPSFRHHRRHDDPASPDDSLKHMSLSPLPRSKAGLATGKASGKRIGVLSNQELFAVQLGKEEVVPKDWIMG
jgi:hypothetical protein